MSIPTDPNHWGMPPVLRRVLAAEKVSPGGDVLASALHLVPHEPCRRLTTTQQFGGHKPPAPARDPLPTRFERGVPS